MTCAHPDLTPLTSYNRGCRCDDRCRAAKREQTRRRTGAQPSRVLRERGAVLGWNCLEPGPLISFCAAHGITGQDDTDTVVRRHGAWASRVPALLRRAAERGWVGERDIDEVAVRLGRHPVMVYGSAWYGLVCQDATPDELEDIGLTAPTEQDAA